MYSEPIPAVSAVSAAGREKRRHVRVEHTGTVEFVGEGRRFSGQAVNISRTGMQVVVNLPESYTSVRSITFRLPNAAGAVDLPCRLVRRHGEHEAAGGHVLGIEFSYESEAQMLLIENYVRELREHELFSARAGSDPRQIPRADCNVDDVQIDRGDVRVLSIENISTDGLLLSFAGALQPFDEIHIRFRLPGSAHRVSVRGRAVYVIGSGFSAVSTAGVRFLETSAADGNRIREYVIQAASQRAAKNLHGRIAAQGLESQYRVDNHAQMLAMLQTLHRQGLHINALFEGDLTIYPLPVGRVSADARSFSALYQCDLPIAASVPGKPVYCSFYLEGSSHYFRSRLLRVDPESLWFEIPQLVYRSEQRSYGRRHFQSAPVVSLLLRTEEDQELRSTGRLLDISRHGFLVEVAAPVCPVRNLDPGCHLAYAIDEGLRLDCHGIIRHVRERRGDDGGRILQIGVEAGVRKDTIHCRRHSEEEWRSESTRSQRANHCEDDFAHSEVVRYRNQHGQEIVGLLNATKTAGPAPVVVIPPAFGKKKECLAPLALTLASNFCSVGRDLVVLRYDGVNRPGESFSDVPNPRRGLEMLQYRLSQGLEDLRATMRFVRESSRYPPEAVVVISFSLSSIDVRKLLADDPRAADFWVSCMGIPAAKSSIGAILGGIDIIGNFKMGIPNGTGGMLGYLVNMDTLAEDLVTSKYAYITDARADMSRIPVPILWIYGTHDRWVVPDEVLDIMSVGCGARRDVIEIPTGHSLRTSDDALKTFRLITRHVYRHLCGDDLDVHEPGRTVMLRTITHERERLKEVQAFDPEAYWRGYLMGGQKNRCGYDFLRNIGDFRRFLSLEAELVDPQPGDRIADMGCGTGLLLESLLARLTDPSRSHGAVSITAVDLVEEALEKTRTKYERLARRFPGLCQHRIEFRRLDLEPNRLLPIKLFVENPGLGFEFLRDRVPGIRALTVEMLEKITCPSLSRIARGAPMDDDNLRFLADILRDGHRSSVLDLNRAARWLTRSLEVSDLVPSRRARIDGPLEPQEYSGLTATDLLFECLQLGRCGPEFSPVFPEGSFSKIVASLFVSYITNADLVVQDFYRLLEPGGSLLVSSMKPDSDISVIFTEYIQKVQNFDLEDTDILNRDLNLDAAREMLNDAASLFTLEEDGYFRFYSEPELVAFLEKAGFTRVRSWDALGCPPQATIVVGHKLPPL
jgi:ubiquinone/menaquinone biosynthesis C-methylase UbiE/c-di-GMP-binding flagellar brake protein YcgR